jgi:ABC-type branched-subunit amino acid transport system ATPase component
VTARLEVRDVVVRFGGVVAVDGVSLDAEPGRITGLIGPNGAGKTTTFNVVSGLVAPAAGAVRLNGADVTAAAPDARARLGLGRTFQRLALFDALTVQENVELGAEARHAGRRPLRHLWVGERERARTRAAAAAAMERCGIGELAERVVGDLSTGQRRLVDLARVLAGGFDVLLLDEPSSGLDPAETDRFAAIVLDLVRDAGVAILLVEHDLRLVRGVCDVLHVLDFGRPIASGPTAAVIDDPVVRRAYLGAPLEETAC